MTALEQALSDYLRLRRGLGYYLERDQGELERFIEFLQQAGAERITTELAVQWARMPATQHPVIWRKRLSTVRGFARYLATLDPVSEIPSTDLLRAHQPRTAPYIYTAAEITELMAAARSLPRPLAAATFETLIGLLASPVCGCVKRSGWIAQTSTCKTGCSTSGPARTIASVRCCYTRALPPRWWSTRGCEISVSRLPPRRRSSSAAGEDRCSRRGSGTPSGC